MQNSELETGYQYFAKSFFISKGSTLEHKLDWLTLLVYYKLGEVPLDEISQRSTLLVLEILPQRMGVVTIDFNL